MHTAEKKLAISGLIAVAVVFICAAIPIIIAQSEISLRTPSDIRYALPLGEGFMAVTATETLIYSKTAELIYSDTQKITQDLSAYDGEKVATYGGDIRIYGEAGLEYSVAVDAQPSILVLDGQYLLQMDETNSLYLYRDGEPIFRRIFETCQLVGARIIDQKIYLAINLDTYSGIICLDFFGNTLDSCEFEGKIDSVESSGTAIALVLDDGLMVYNTASGDYTHCDADFSQIRGTDDGFLLLCSERLCLMDESGKITASFETPYGEIRRFPIGAETAIVYGDRLIYLDKNLDEKYSYTNGDNPSDVLINTNLAVFLWSDTAEIHRK